MPDAELPELPFLSNVGLVMTYKCQVTCSHCILEAGPHRNEVMPVRDACAWIRQIAAYRNGYVRSLTLTGGEPFYDIVALRLISEFADSCGLTVSAMTNAYWAVTKSSAVRVLRDLPALRMLAVSADAHHQKAIPFERVENAIQAARECDMAFNVHVCAEDKEDPAYKELLRRIGEVAGPGVVNTALTFPAGRALKYLGQARFPESEDPPVSACSAGSSPMVFPDGRVISCLGPVINLRSPHPLVLGNLKKHSLGEIFDEAESNPLLHAIRVWGPHKLVALIQATRLNAYLPTLYVKDSVCMACHQLLATPELTGFFAALAADAEFGRVVAFARLRRLHERRMVELLREEQ